MNIQIQYQQILLQVLLHASSSTGTARPAITITSEYINTSVIFGLYLPMSHHRLWGHSLETADKELYECSIAPALSLVFNC